jgi:type I restriction enzyme S subunit
MALIKYKLGDLIQQRREKYDGTEALLIKGVSREGFISPKQEDADLSIYNVFYRYDFVFNPARMELNSIAINTYYDKAICSSLYEIFYVTRTDILLPDYLNLYIKRDEFARKCWFEAVGSARNYFRVSNLSEFVIELPSISIQQKYVNIFKAMVANQESYERGLEDLKLTIDAELDRIKRSSPVRPVGELLQEIDVRNADGSIEDVQGINIYKHFMPSVANTNGVNLSNYKVVKKGQFAYSGMQTGRDECIRIALFNREDTIIISPAYSVFEVKDKSVLAEYIMMWFSRAESDRRGWFMSDASIRTNLDLERFYEIKIPVPEMARQEALVELYSVYNTRRNINETLKAQIKDICPILIKGSLEEGNA